jgi:hypothetical protein
LARPAFVEVTRFADYVTYRHGYYAASHFTQLESSGSRTGATNDYSESKVTPY